MAPVIEPKRHSDRDLAVRVLRALQDKRLRAPTAEDVVALTGLPVRLAARGLMLLARELPCHLEVLQGGALVYRFRTLDRRASLSEQLTTTMDRLWSRYGRPYLDPAVYALSATLLVGLGSAMMEFSTVLHGKGTRGLVELAGAGILMVGLVVGLPFLAAALLTALGVASFMKGGDASPFTVVLLPILVVMLLRMGGALVRWLAPRGGIWLAVRGFFLGPPRQRVDALDDEARLVALIRSRDGVICLADLVRTFGWTLDEAYRQTARIVVDYHGELVADASLHLVLSFDAFKGAAADTLAPARQRTPQPPPFFGCSRRTAALMLLWITVAAGLGLARPEAPAFPGPNWKALQYIAHRPKRLFDRIDDVANDGVGAWPLVLGFGPLAIRLAGHARRRRGYARGARLDGAITLALEHPWPRKPGDVDLDALALLGAQHHDDGSVTFPELDGGHAVAQAIRRAAPKDRKERGRVVFSTEDAVA